MKQVIRIITALVVITGLIVTALVVIARLNMGRGEKEQPAPKAGDTGNWEPEAVKPPEGHSHDDGHDHCGHNH